MFKIKKKKLSSGAKKIKKDPDQPVTATSVSTTPGPATPGPSVPSPVNEDSNDKHEVSISPENSRDGFENQIKQLSPETRDLGDDKFWTQSDQVLLRSLIEVYQGNFCVIAKCMGNKACKQVNTAFD
jgi:hypothetical protein